MEFQEFVKQRKRMCKSIHNVRDCPLAMYGCSYCIEDCFENTQRAEEIVSKWAAEHPVMTNRQKAEEIFGVKLNTKGCLSIKCPHNEDGMVLPCETCDYYNFWDQEYKEKES